MGISSSDQEYKEGFDLLSERTDEYGKLLRLILNRVLPNLPSKSTFLDVGAGRGNLALGLSIYFANTVIVEPNQIYCDELSNKIMQLGNKVISYAAPLQDVDLDEHTFDLILCAHVLYYVDPEQRTAFLSKLINSLSPQGRMVLVSVSKKSKINMLYRRFLQPNDIKNIPYSETLIDLLKLFKCELEIISLECSISVVTADEFSRIVSFLVPLPKTQQLEKHEQALAVASYFKTKSGYCITNWEYAIVLKHTE